MSDDHYAWWRQALENFSKKLPVPPISADHPQCGRYERAGTGRFPVAIFPDAHHAHGGSLLCWVDGVSRDPCEEWTWVAKHPVSEVAFHHRITTGKWPDETARAAQSIMIVEPRKAFKAFEKDDRLIARIQELCELDYHTKGRIPPGCAVKQEEAVDA